MTSSAPQVPPVKLLPYGVIVAIFLVIEVTGVFEQTMIYVAVPTLMGVFSMDAAGVSWAITVFLLVGAGTAAISGRLGDMYGRKKLLIILMAISAVGSLVSVIAGNFEGILIGRALQGTSAALFPLLVGIAREVVPARRVPVLVSLTTGSAIIGGSVAALIAGILLDTAGWHSMFIASGILSVIALLCALALPRSVVAPGEKGRLDVLGGVLLAPAVAAVLFGVNSSRSQGASPLVIGLIIGGIVLFGAWILLELRIENPMFNLRLFRQRSLALALVVTGLVGLAIFAAAGLMNAILMQSPTDLPIGLGLTPTQAGLYGLIAGAVGFALSPVGGKVAARFGAKITLAAGIIISLVGYVGYGLGAHNLPLAIVATVVTGLGSALIIAGIPNLIVEVVPPQSTGEAVGIIYSVGRTLFTAVGTVVVGMLLAADLVPGTTAPTTTAWWGTIGFIAVTGVLALIATFMIKTTIPMDQRGTVVEAVAEVETDVAEDTAPAGR